MMLKPTIGHWSKTQVLSGVVSTLLVLAVAACQNSNKELSEEVTIEAPAVPLTAAEERTLHTTAGEVVFHINQARSAIESKQTMLATERVQQAVDQLSDVEEMLPRYKLTSEMRLGTADVKSTENVKPDLVPIAAEVDEVSLLAPIQAVHAAHGAAATEGKSRSSGDVEVSAIQEYTKAELDVAKTKAELILAQAALDAGKPEEADQALRAAQVEGVMFEFVAVNRPLKRAADNLNQALYNLRENRHQAASEDLDSAVAALREYEGPTGNTRTPEVRDLQEEIAAVRSDLDHGGVASDQLISRVRDSWQRIVGWL